MAEDASSVSRSGRVRKKSSKLTDYQSPDELDSTRPPGKRRSLTSVSSAATAQVQELPPDQLLATEEDPGPGLFTPGVGIGLQLEDIDVREEELDEAPDLEAEDSDQDSDAGVGLATPRTEIIKKPPHMPQTQPRARPRPRVTAYMLWARQARPKLLASQPGLASASLNTRLAELWSQSVSSAEKLSWKRRSRKLAAQQRERPRPAPASTGGHHPGRTSSIVLQSLARSHPRPDLGPAPLDVAAHLTLLGESLSIIGSRLREHEGQIAVSGSLSVLLDSLLCSLGPLVCLTSKVPELNGADPATLTRILDNVAYIMPGL